MLLAFQVAIGTDDVYKSGEVINHVIQEHGGKITRQPGPIPGINTKIVSFLDPDGWKTVSCKNTESEHFFPFLLPNPDHNNVAVAPFRFWLITRIF